MEWILLIGCFGLNCMFGTTQVSLPSQAECIRLSEQFTGSYGRGEPMYFSKCFGTANLYQGDKQAFPCATAIRLPTGALRAVSIPCTVAVGTDKRP